MNFDRDGAPNILRDALQQFADRKIKLANSVSTAVALLDEIESGTPTDPSSTAVHDALLRGASDDEIDALVLAELGFQLRRNGYAQARPTAAQRALRAISGDAPAIHAQMKKLADALIERLTKVAALGDVTLDEVVRENRTADAQLLAGAEIDAAELNVLHQLRQLIWEGNSFGVPPVDCSWWKDPTTAHGHGHGAEYIISSIRSGAVAWYPDPTEAAAAAQPVAARLNVLAAESKQAIVNQFGTA